MLQTNRVPIPHSQLTAKDKWKYGDNGPELWTRKSITTWIDQLEATVDNACRVRGRQHTPEERSNLYRGLMTGGKIIGFEMNFVKVERNSFLPIDDITFQLAVAVYGSRQVALEKVSQMTEDAWAKDLSQAKALWEELGELPIKLVDEQTTGLLTQPRITKSVERTIQQQACIQIGKQPAAVMDLNLTRVRPKSKRQHNLAKE